MQGYTLQAIDNLMGYLAENGYEARTAQDGNLGYGKIVFVAPSENMWNFIVAEVPLNCCSCCHRVRKCRKISKSLWAEIEKYEQMKEE